MMVKEGSLFSIIPYIEHIPCMVLDQCIHLKQALVTILLVL